MDSFNFKSGNLVQSPNSPIFCSFPGEPGVHSTIYYIYCIIYILVWIGIVLVAYFFYYFNGKLNKIKLSNGHINNLENLV